MRKTNRKPRDPWYKKAVAIFLTVLLVITMFFYAVLVICADMAEHPELSGTTDVKEIIEDVMSA